MSSAVERVGRQVLRRRHRLRPRKRQRDTAHPGVRSHVGADRESPTGAPAEVDGRAVRQRRHRRTGPDASSSTKPVSTPGEDSVPASIATLNGTLSVPSTLPAPCGCS